MPKILSEFRPRGLDRVQTASGDELGVLAVKTTTESVVSVRERENTVRRKRKR